MYRHQFPVLRILLPFVAGIAVVLYAGLERPLSGLVLFAVWILLFGYAAFSKKMWKYSTRWLFGCMASLFMFMFGYQIAVFNNHLSDKAHFSKVRDAQFFVARVNEPLVEKEHSFKTTLQINEVYTHDTVYRCFGKMICYFKKDTTVSYPLDGQTIIFSGNVAAISPPQNPGAFNYKRYLAASNVFHQVYLPAGNYIITDAPIHHSVMRQARAVRNYFLDVLKKNGLHGQEYAVAAALILGQEDDLDAETLREYSGAGVMHILSVSGLHVGIVYLVLNFLLGFLNRNRTTIIIKTIMIIVLVWFYALITGFSPSVARSAAMFSIVLIAVLVNRNSHIINSIAISALILLAYNPNYLLNIGFQLSYLAVTGIVLIYNWLYEKYNAYTWIGDKIWQVVAVSVAAQLVTLPLTLYYFHQFPNYFLLANIVAIPLSSLVIYSGMIVLVTSMVPVVSNFFGQVTVLLLKFLNGSIGWIENLPYAVSSGIPFKLSEMWALYLVMILFFIAIAFRNKRALFTGFAVFLIFFSLRSYYGSIAANQNKLIVYSANKSSVIQWVNGTNSIVLADSVFKADVSKQDFILKRANTLMGIRESNFLPLLSNVDSLVQFSPFLSGFANFYLFNDKTVAIIQKLPQAKGLSAPLKVDYLILSGRMFGHLAEILPVYNPQQVILDGNFPGSELKKWISEGKQAGIPVHSVKKDGAFIAEI